VPWSAVPAPSVAISGWTAGADAPAQGYGRAIVYLASLPAYVLINKVMITRPVTGPTLIRCNGPSQDDRCQAPSASATGPPARCVVLKCAGALISRGREETLWQQVFTAQPERRREFEPSPRRSKKRPAPWPPATGHGLGRPAQEPRPPSQARGHLQTDRGLCPRWTNGQAEQMHRTVKEATVKAFHYPDLEALQAHVLAFVTAYNFAKHLKALRRRTPFQMVRDAWQADPSAFKTDPHHLIPGPHS
jgi:hypothetical protein